MANLKNRYAVVLIIVRHTEHDEQSLASKSDMDIIGLAERLRCGSGLNDAERRTLDAALPDGSDDD